ncbi:hypothetical protein SUSAZ_09595 [Sulfolobus acidocaldarius SUSAZ]|nr:hypothetical protein SUSAZ_09595 [Sulfolobus acidocaldarius SUSAZ]
MIRAPNLKDILKQIEGSNYFKVEIDPTNMTVNSDAYLLEELSYRGRIFIATNVPSKLAYEILNRFNLDSFITRVVSAEDVGVFTTNPKFFEYLYRMTGIQRGTGYFITSNTISINNAKSNQFKVVMIDREGGNSVNLVDVIRVRDLKKIVELTGKSYVDSKIGDSSLRCK